MKTQTIPGKTPIIASVGDYQGPGPEIMAADTLVGDRVVNIEGEDLGRVRNIMIDVANGRVAYAVLAVGGVLGIGDRLFAVPWGSLALNAIDKCFVLDFDKEHLKNAPGFDKDHWPSMADPRFANSIYEYYDTPPYWN